MNEKRLYPRIITLILSVGLFLSSEAQTKITAIELEEGAKPASYQGGTSALYHLLTQNISYPADAIESNAEGTVIVSFLVTEKGKVADIKTVQPIHPSLDIAVIEAIKLTSKRWMPAQSKDSLNIVSRLQVPFKFELAERLDDKDNVEVKYIYHRNYGNDPRMGATIDYNNTLSEYATLADRAIENNKQKKAARLYSKAYRGEPTNPRYLIRKAELLIELEKTEKACKVLNRARKLEGNEAEELYQLHCI